MRVNVAANTKPNKKLNADVATVAIDSPLVSLFLIPFIPTGIPGIDANANTHSNTAAIINGTVMPVAPNGKLAAPIIKPAYSPAKHIHATTIIIFTSFPIIY